MRRVKRLLKKTASKVVAWSIVLFAVVYSVVSVFDVKAEELTQEQVDAYRQNYTELQFANARSIEEQSTSDEVVLDYGSGNIVTVTGTDLVYGHQDIVYDEYWRETSYYVYALGDVTVTAVPTDGYTATLYEEFEDVQNTVINYEGLTAGNHILLEGIFDDGMLDISFENAGVEGNVATFHVQGEDITVTPIGAEIDSSTLRVAREDLSDITFQVSENFDIENMRVYVKGQDDYVATIQLADDRSFDLNGLTLPRGWLVISIGTLQDEPQPGPEPASELEIFVDGYLSWEENVATVFYNEGEVKLSFSGGFARDDRYVMDPSELDNFSVTVMDGFDEETMQLVLHGPNDYRQVLDLNDGVATFAGLHLPEWVHISIEGNYEPGPDPGPEPSGNIQARVIITGGEGGYEYDYHWYNPETDQDEVIHEYLPYTNTFMGAEVGINDSYLAYPFPEYDDEHDEEAYPTRAEAELWYNGEENAETVDFRFSTFWHQKYYDTIKINGVSYKVSDYFDYDNRDEWLDAFANMHIEFVIPGVAKAEDNVYNVEVKIRDDGARYISAFSWTADPEQEYEMRWDDELEEPVYVLDPEGNKIPGKNYIGHSSLEFVKATYTVKNHNYTVTAENIKNGIDENGYFQSEDGYFTYWHWPEADYDDGEIDMPESGVVTMRVIPEYGYQVIHVNAEEINENGEFTTTDNGVGEFTVQLHGGGGYFRAEVVPIEDEVKPNSDKVVSGTINLGNVLDGGTAQLIVSDIQLSNDKIAGFENAAGEFTIANYLDIDLYQVLYKGTDNSDDVWSDKIDELENEATISIVLEDGINAEEIVLVHNVHDGDQYEIINPVSYDAATRTLTFKTRSFSNYAIAYKNGQVEEREEVTRVNVTVDKTGIKVNTALSNDLFSGVQVDNQNVIVAGHAYMEVETEKVYVDNDMFASDNVLETFVAGKSYIFGIILHAKDGYKLTDNTKVYINGAEADLRFEEGELLIATEKSPIQLVEEQDPIVNPDPEPDPEPQPEPAPEPVVIDTKNEDDNSKEASEAVQKVVEQIIDNKEVEELPQELKEAIVEAINNNDEISVELSTEEITEENVSKEDMDLIKEAVEDLVQVIGYFDIDLNVYVNDVEVGQLTKLTEPINVTLDVKELIEKLPEVKEGFTRIYKVLRVHDGKTTELDAKLDANGKLVFKTDKFSTYTVTYTDVATPATPNTGDNIMTYVALLLVSVAGLGALGIYFYRSTKSN